MTGYKNPPEHSRFKPGESGNPKGRPRKKPSNPYQLMLSTLQEKTAVIVGGKRKFMTKGEYIYQSQVNKAMQGDRNALRFLEKIMFNKHVLNAKVVQDEEMRLQADPEEMAALQEFESFFNLVAAYKTLGMYTDEDPHLWFNKNYAQLSALGLVKPEHPYGVKVETSDG